MATPASFWRFEQLGGPRKVLELRDHAAPHGRPRQDPVVEEDITIRTARTEYASDIPRTLHVFGRRHEPYEIKGRFSDKRAGVKGFAIAKRDEVKNFVADQQDVLITWSDLVSVQGFIENFKARVESAHEVEWSMTIDIAEDHYVGFPVFVPQSVPPKTVTNQLLLHLTDATDLLEDLPLKGDILDTIDSLFSPINEMTSALSDVADQIDQFATAPLYLLAKFNGASQQLRTVITRARNQIEAWSTDYALESQRADDEQRFWAMQSTFGASMVGMLTELDKADQAAAIAQRGQLKAIYVAQQGDTWESIAAKFYGDPGRASDLREANAVPAGEAPAPGTAYQIPQ